ncbi:MAG: glycosyltransferase [Gammaproteobacteria bacterium]|nr:glycosyltransferase [Gammaproteobacteria bacterium]
MQISVIVSVYRDVEGLAAIVRALEAQTDTDFELIISEDGESVEMAQFVATLSRARLIHSFQPDIGWRKNKALNNAIRKASGDYLIFIDGDCVPHPRFVESYRKIARVGEIASGRRVMLGAGYSQCLRQEKITTKVISSSYLVRVFPLLWDKAKALEEGLYFSERGIFSALSRRPMRDVLGCNFGVHRTALEAINGFDEDYVGPGAGEDNDIRWRLVKNGVKLVSSRNMAILYHLEHRKTKTSDANYPLMQRKQQEGCVRCQHGLLDLSAESQSV